MGELTIWLGPALDGALILVLGIALWRLGQDPTRVWQAREAGLRAIFADLQRLVGAAEAGARDLDARLAAHAERLRGLLAEARAAASAAGPASVARDRRAETDAAPEVAAPEHVLPRRTATAARETWREAQAAGEDEQDVGRRVRELVARATPVEEIARRLGLPAAEVRLLINLQAAKAAVRRQSENGAGEAARFEAGVAATPSRAAAPSAGTLRTAMQTASVERPRIVRAL